MSIKTVTWDDITIDKYIRIRDILALDTDDYNKHIHIISLCHDIKLSEFDNMTVEDLKAYIRSLAILQEQPVPRFLSMKYNFIGMEFELVPNANKMITGQYIDYCNIANEDNYNISLLIAVCMRPKNGIYAEGYDVQELSSVINENMCILDALGICFFFKAQLKSLTKAILGYLGRNIKESKNMTQVQKEAINISEETIKNSMDGLSS